MGDIFKSITDFYWVVLHDIYRNQKKPLNYYLCWCVAIGLSQKPLTYCLYYYVPIFCRNQYCLIRVKFSFLRGWLFVHLSIRWNWIHNIKIFSLLFFLQMSHWPSPNMFIPYRYTVSKNFSRWVSLCRYMNISGFLHNYIHVGNYFYSINIYFYRQKSVQSRLWIIQKDTLKMKIKETLQTYFWHQCKWNS